MSCLYGETEQAALCFLPSSTRGKQQTPDPHSKATNTSTWQCILLQNPGTRRIKAVGCQGGAELVSFSVPESPHQSLSACRGFLCGWEQEGIWSVIRIPDKILIYLWLDSCLVTLVIKLTGLVMERDSHSPASCHKALAAVPNVYK